MRLSYAPPGAAGSSSLFWFTMYQCLLCNSAIVAIDPCTLESDEFARAVRRFRQSSVDAYGHEGLPSAICRRAAEACLDGTA